MKSSAGIQSTSTSGVLILPSGGFTQNATLINTSNVEAKWWIGTDTANYVILSANTAMTCYLNLNNQPINFGPLTSGTVTAHGFVS